MIPLRDNQASRRITAVNLALIAANVAARTGAIPWRMTSQDYLAAVAEGPAVGRVTPVPWDADLAAELTRAGVTVPEERLAENLLGALCPDS